jgi:hypothetical protein
MVINYKIQRIYREAIDSFSSARSAEEKVSVGPCGSVANKNPVNPV